MSDVYRKKTVIPTYPVRQPLELPLFIEGRVYQGASGKVYPLPYTDQLSDEKVDREYDIVYLENEYLSVMVMPEMGGKILRGYDKVNDYDFIYYNEVVKPALIGLAGPWVSGGIEFNWPQHHRPTTFMPVDCTIAGNNRGGQSVYVGEIEPMGGQKCTAEISLDEGRSYIRLSVRLYNPTPCRQPFMWWNNLAVPVNDQYRYAFPRDIEYTYDHDRKARVSWPTLRGVFANNNGVDYGQDGVDSSRFPNVVTQSSFMSRRGDCNFEFLSGYDYGRGTGIVYIADRDISPGKKLFTWGYSDFAKAWEKNLTDANGPYSELMTGVFTDNQPDFTWIEPYETKSFTVCWYPIAGIGHVKNATADAAVGIEQRDGKTFVGVCASGSFEGARIEIGLDGETLFAGAADLSPAKGEIVTVDREVDWERLTVRVLSRGGRLLVGMEPVPRGIKEPASPRTPARLPGDIETADELFINGMHLEQYKQHNFFPEDYYLEALRRDAGDIRCNGAMGLLAIKKGQFAEAERYLRKASERLMSRNENPYDCEILFNLGLSLQYQGKFEEARRWFACSTWSYACKSRAYYRLAVLCSRNQDYRAAADYLGLSLRTDGDNLKALNLRTAMLRKLGETRRAEELNRAVRAMDKLDFGAHLEYCLLSSGKDNAAEAFGSLSDTFRGNAEYFALFALDYAEAGLLEDAETVLRQAISGGTSYPMVYYALGYIRHLAGDQAGAAALIGQAEKLSPKYCFPYALSYLPVLEYAGGAFRAPMARYYLGNFRYDHRDYADALEEWEQAVKAGGNYYALYRNLALAYFDKFDDAGRAAACMDKAFALAPDDARLFYELLSFRRRGGASPEALVRLLDEHRALALSRDDTAIEYVSLLTSAGRLDDADEILRTRRFHIFEGGEGRLPAAHAWLQIQRGRKFAAEGDYDRAAETVRFAAEYRENYSEAKRFHEQQAHIYTALGEVYEAAGHAEQAAEAYALAAADQGEEAALPRMMKARALEKTGRGKEAKAVYEKMLADGLLRLQEKDLPNYFGIRIKPPRPFDGGPARTKQLDALTLIFLAHSGLGDGAAAAEARGQLAALDRYNFDLWMADQLRLV